MTEEETIDPRILQLKFLKELKDAMISVEQVTRSTIEQGIVESLNPVTVTTALTASHPPYRDKQWFGVKVTNDGANSAWVTVNSDKSLEVEVKPNETWGVDFKTAIVQDVAHRTETGTTTLRIRGQR